MSDNSIEASRKTMQMKRAQEKLSGLSGLKFLGFEEVDGDPMRFMMRNKPKFLVREHPHKPGWSRTDYIEWIRKQLMSQHVGGKEYFLAFGIGVGIFPKVDLDEKLDWVTALFALAQSFAFLATDFSWGFRFGISEDVFVEIIERDAEERGFHPSDETLPDSDNNSTQT